jgi:hypothetical protein
VFATTTQEKLISYLLFQSIDTFKSLSLLDFYPACATTLFYDYKENNNMTGSPAKTVWIKCSLVVVVAPPKLHSLSFYHYALHYKSAGFLNGNAITDETSTLPTLHLIQPVLRTISG